MGVKMKVTITWWGKKQEISTPPQNHENNEENDSDWQPRREYVRKGQRKRRGDYDYIRPKYILNWIINTPTTWMFMAFFAVLMYWGLR